MKRKSLSVLVGAVTAVAVIMSMSGAAAGSATGGSTTQQRETAEYHVKNVRTVEQRSAIAGTGAAINDVEDSRTLITATPAEVAAIRALGFEVGSEAPPPSTGLGVADFPGADSRYHNYAEMVAVINRAVADHPGLITKRVIGKSYQNRDLYAIKISDNAATDENEPEVLFTHHQHAREHITVEMAVYLINLFTDAYTTDSKIKSVVDSREIWILPDVNPDGGEFDISTGSYKSWRKNRQPNAGSTAIGTDLNRNWDYKWGCCNGSSTSPGSDTYRGASPSSAPEVRAVTDFVRGRELGGVQQITAAIDFHAYGELVLWPFGWTYDQVVPGMTREEYDTFATLGRAMAQTNNYTPEQSSDLYVTDGAVDDFLWGDQKIYAYTFEMYPGGSSGGGFYPPDEVISRETARNKAAVLHLLDYADCPPRAINKPCGAPETPGRTFENTANVAIPDAGGAVTSPVAVSAIAGNAPATLKVDVDVKHTYRGDVVLDLVAPDGTAFRLKNSSGDSADNIITTYTVNASAEAANGTWSLRAQDIARADTGYIDGWKLTF